MPLDWSSFMLFAISVVFIFVVLALLSMTLKNAAGYEELEQMINEATAELWKKDEGRSWLNGGKCPHPEALPPMIEVEGLQEPVLGGLTPDGIAQEGVKLKPGNAIIYLVHTGNEMTGPKGFDFGVDIVLPDGHRGRERKAGTRKVGAIVLVQRLLGGERAARGPARQPPGGPPRREPRVCLPLAALCSAQAAENAKSHGSRLRRGAAPPSNPRARWVTQGRQRPLP